MIATFEPTGPIAETSILTLINRYKKIPTSYIDFLRKYSGLVPKENVLSGSETEISVKKFFEAAEITLIASDTDGFPQRHVPIACDGIGNIFCIFLETGAIYFWDHETGDLEYVGRDFNNFIARMELVDKDSVKLDWKKVKKIWVNPNFKPKFD